MAHLRTISRRSTMLLALLSLLPGCSPMTEVRVATSEASLTEALSFQQAKTLVDSGKVVEAVTAFRKLLRTGGPSLPVLNGLAIAYAELGRPDLAATFFARALALAPADPATLNNIGFAAIRRKDVDLARHYLERAKQAGGDLATVRRNLEIVERLESGRVSSSPIDAALFGERESTLFQVERQTVSSVRLSGLLAGPGPSIPPFEQVSSLEPAPPLELRKKSSEVVIDFSELYDPWSTSDRSTEPSF